TTSVYPGSCLSNQDSTFAATEPSPKSRRRRLKPTTSNISTTRALTKNARINCRQAANKATAKRLLKRWPRAHEYKFKNTKDATTKSAIAVAACNDTV